MLSCLEQMFPLLQHLCIASTAFLSALPLPPPSPSCLRGSEARLRPFLRVCTCCVVSDIDPSAIETIQFVTFLQKKLDFCYFCCKTTCQRGQHRCSFLVCLRLGCNSWPIQRWVSSGALEIARDNEGSKTPSSYSPPTFIKADGVGGTMSINKE